MVPKAMNCKNVMNTSRSVLLPASFPPFLNFAVALLCGSDISCGMVSSGFCDQRKQSSAYNSPATPCKGIDGVKSSKANFFFATMINVDMRRTQFYPGFLHGAMPLSLMHFFRTSERDDKTLVFSNYQAPFEKTGGLSCFFCPACQFSVSCYRQLSVSSSCQLVSYQRSQL